MKDKITFAQFLEIEKQLEIKIGTILEADFLPGNKKMVKMTVSFGEGDERTVITNIGNRLAIPFPMLKGAQFPFITNLMPAIINGVESSAMIMVTENSEGKVEIPVAANLTAGAKLL